MDKPTVILDFSQIDALPTKRVREYPLSPQQERIKDFILYSGRNALIDGCIGAGKTEICTSILEEGSRTQNILYLTRNVVARDTARDRTTEGRVETIQGFCNKEAGGDYFPNYTKMAYEYIRRRWKASFDLVLVDEVQSLCPLLLNVVLTIPTRQIAFFGDPAQSNYMDEWASTYMGRGALGPETFDYLEEKRNCLRIPLVENWRSSETIVNLLESVFEKGMVAKGPKENWETAIIARHHKTLDYLERTLLQDTKLTYRRKIRPKAQNEAKYSYKRRGSGGDIGLTLLVAHACPGDEFRRVFIVDWEEKSEEDRYLLYTSLGRATEEVYILGEGSWTKYFPITHQITESSLYLSLISPVRSLRETPDIDADVEAIDDA